MAGRLLSSKIHKVGLLGSDSSHAERIPEVLNLDRHPSYWPDSRARVWSIWGEDDQRTRQAAQYGEILETFAKPQEVVDASDIVFVIARHPDTHLDLARLAIEAGKPVYVDKPLARTPNQASEILSLAKLSPSPVTSFSTMRFASHTLRFELGIQNVGPVRYASYLMVRNF